MHLPISSLRRGEGLLGQGPSHRREESSSPVEGSSVKAPRSAELPRPGKGRRRRRRSSFSRYLPSSRGFRNLFLLHQRGFQRRLSLPVISSILLTKAGPIAPTVVVPAVGWEGGRGRGREGEGEGERRSEGESKGGRQEVLGNVRLSVRACAHTLGHVRGHAAGGGCRDGG